MASSAASTLSDSWEKYDKMSLIYSGTFSVINKGKLKNSPDPATVVMKQNFGRSRLTEIRGYQKLQNCDQILKIFDICDNFRTIVLELCMCNLQEFLQYHRINQPEQKNLARQFLRGVEAIHAKNMVHGDIKMANLLMTFDGILKITDFESMLENNVHKPFYRIRTVGYTPPEFLLTSDPIYVNTTMDLWSAGLILFKIFTNNSKCLISEDSKPDSESELRAITYLFGCITGPFVSSLNSYRKYYEWAKHYDTSFFANTLERLMMSHTQSERDLIERLMKVEPSERATASQVLQSASFSAEPLPSADLTDAVRDYMEKRRITRPPAHDAAEVDWQTIAIPESV
ncbi:cell division protein kinase 2 homolog CRK1-like [Nilaparvata lugens]|uniref:cell division protein kinase 2 homolog CRK1-like n=1 Tax=Nilaparvata lugens TaxID=108931 RepID=UPI000B98317A|nr:cell division protein kinase 2 homolog CRK1-like [Nilaparvata lugens]XP_039298443.1 cell division protein kinase 2 homolog CRK1-like [Nilaparvata lugens]